MKRTIDSNRIHSNRTYRFFRTVSPQQHHPETCLPRQGWFVVPSVSKFNSAFLPRDPLSCRVIAFQEVVFSSNQQGCNPDCVLRFDVRCGFSMLAHFTKRQKTQMHHHPGNQSTYFFWWGGGRGKESRLVGARVCFNTSNEQDHRKNVFPRGISK